MTARGAASDRQRALIGSCGGLTGVYLARRLALDPTLEVLGADVSDVTPGKFFCDRVFRLPPASDPGFVGALCELIRAEGIELYLPTHSSEVREVARSADAVRRSGASFLVSDREAFAALDGKADANMSLRFVGVPVPEMYETPGSASRFPVFGKRRRGSGSAGAVRYEGASALEAGWDDSYAYFELAEGPEYTVDCMFDAEGRLLAHNQRERVKTIGGAVSITRNAAPVDVEPYLERIAERWTLRGCVNFQYILTSEGPRFIDVNLRYPSGGLPLTVESGVDVPAMTVRLLRGDPIEPGEYASDLAPRTMYRYFDEIFEVGT